MRGSKKEKGERESKSLGVGLGGCPILFVAVETGMGCKNLAGITS